MNNKEIKICKKLLQKIRPIPNVPEELFVPLMRKSVPVVLDLAIIRNGKILLTYRDDRYYKGWHFPGSLMSPKETPEQTVSRVLSSEVGLTPQKITFVRVFDYFTDKRFHSVSLFFRCRTVGNPTNGKWFSRCPADIIPEHRQLWLAVKPYIKHA